MKNLFKIKELISFLKDEKLIYIQPHNYPDHDAIASAFGLQYLFKQFSIKSEIVYCGSLNRTSLEWMIDKLKIKLIKSDDCKKMVAEDKIVIVDGCKGNNNVFDLIGDEIAVIDHHEVNRTILEDVKFIDIKNYLGSCCTLIASYYDELKVKIPKDVATAFLIGINMDTSNLTRAVHQKDLDYLAKLYFEANTEFVHFILRNFSDLEDLTYYKYLINNIKIKDEVAFCYFEDGCKVNTLGILSDFVLALKEVDLVVLCAKNNSRINFSLRNEAKNWNASTIVQQMLKKVGSGGGHSHMAGGIMFNADNFDEIQVYNNFLSITGKNN